MKASSLVFYRTGVQPEDLVPAEIFDIFHVYTRNSEKDDEARLVYFFEVKRFLKAELKGNPDPFIRYPGFGASLWSVRTDPASVVIPADRVVCHGIRRKWNADTYVMKPAS